MPTPRSATLIAIDPPRRSAEIVIGVSGLEYFAAFSNRLQITFFKKPPSALTTIAAGTSIFSGWLSSTQAHAWRPVPLGEAD